MHPELIYFESAYIDVINKTNYHVARSSSILMSSTHVFVLVHIQLALWIILCHLVLAWATSSNWYPYISYMFVIVSPLAITSNRIAVLFCFMLLRHCMLALHLHYTFVDSMTSCVIRIDLANPFYYIYVCETMQSLARTSHTYAIIWHDATLDNNYAAGPVTCCLSHMNTRHTLYRFACMYVSAQPPYHTVYCTCVYKRVSVCADGCTTQRIHKQLHNSTYSKPTSAYWIECCLHAAYNHTNVQH